MVRAMMLPKTVKVSHLYWSLTALWAIAGSDTSGNMTARQPRMILFFIFMFFKFMLAGSNLVGFADQFLGHFVELLGLDRVVAGDAPGDDELGQREKNAEVDHAENLGLEQVGEIRCADRKQEVIDDRQDHQSGEEPHLLGVERLKAGIVVDRRPVK